jgi:hypothetical protein
MQTFGLLEVSDRKHGRDPRYVPRIQKAKALCASCPVIAECGAFAKSSTDYPMVGVWAGEYVTYETAIKRAQDARKAEEDARKAEEAADAKKDATQEDDVA